MSRIQSSTILATQRQADDGRTYWLAWSTNYISAEGGHITHAQVMEEAGNKTLCGVRVAEGSLTIIPQETLPGCKKCLRILQKRGVYKPCESCGGKGDVSTVGKYGGTWVTCDSCHGRGHQHFATPAS